MSSRARSLDAPRPSVEAAYAVCRRMLRRHDPTYFVAVRCLPADVQPAVYALYGFVRGADEIVDGRRRPPDPVARLAALDAWEAELERGLAEGGSDHPVVAALVDAGERLELPLTELRAYMASMRVDVAPPVRFKTRADLERYVAGIGASVGRIMASIFSATAEREAFARLGLAFQLTNLLRDVREDYRLDRVYLPADERARFSVEETDLARADASPGLCALIAEEVARARRLFDGAAPAVAAAPSWGRAGIRLAQGVYLAVLDRIEEIGFNVLGRSTRPRPWRLARVATGALRCDT